jgi:ribose transport system permease protein
VLDRRIDALKATSPVTTFQNLIRLRYRYLPDHLIGELLSKRWADNAVPFLALIVVMVVFGSITPHMFSAGGLYDLSGQASDFCLMALALTVVVLSGGIDLSISSIFALCALTVLTSLNAYHLPLWEAVVLTVAVGAVCGAVNGVLIGYLRLRAFLTTLVTLIMFRSAYEILLPLFATRVVLGSSDSDLWANLQNGSLFGLSYSVYIAGLLAVVLHIVLSRSRAGWHIAAVGGSRRSAYNAGIPIRRVLFLTYVYSGILVAIAAILFGARLGSVGSDTGAGLEISALTAVVLGGTTLGGGRGSVAKALLGSAIVLIMTNGLLEDGVTGTTSAMVMGITLLFAVWLDVRWVKNRHKVIDSTYVSPAYLKLPECPNAEVGAPGVYSVNDALRNAETIGLGDVEGPEDVLVDRTGNLYSGSRHGEIHRWFAPDFGRHEIFAHVGGATLGMNFDRDDNLVVCVGGMGLYMVTPVGKVVKLTDETNRSMFSVIDDSRIRLADDLDIAPDGRIFFSEASVRYNDWDWPVDMIESRGNGRLICYDPRDGSTRTVVRNLIFANGITCLPDGESLLFTESWACKVSRYWFEGPKKGRIETVLDNLPGYPDNINRASDGNFWLCLVGMRGPALDLAITQPGFRRRMTKRVAQANWMFPNINTGCILKMTLDGQVLQSLWDKGGVNHPMVTSCKEHKGYLYIAGVFNNRVGKWKIPGADPNWSGPEDYWGKRHD